VYLVVYPSSQLIVVICLFLNININLWTPWFHCLYTWWPELSNSHLLTIHPCYVDNTVIH